MGGIRKSSANMLLILFVHVWAYTAATNTLEETILNKLSLRQTNFLYQNVGNGLTNPDPYPFTLIFQNFI